MGNSSAKLQKDPSDKCNCQKIQKKNIHAKRTCIAYSHVCICRQQHKQYIRSDNDGSAIAWGYNEDRLVVRTKYEGYKHCKAQQHYCSCTVSGAPNCIAYIHDEQCVCIKDCKKFTKNMCNASSHKCICSGYGRKLSYVCTATTHPCVCYGYTQQYISTKYCKATDHPCLCHVDEKECHLHKVLHVL